MHKQKRILVSWYADPRYIPPFVLSDRQVTVGPKSFADQPAMMFSAWTPAGAHDLKGALDAAGIPTEFDAVVVWADASGVNLPLNLVAFGCPTVLCAGDTQHLKTPLNAMIEYAKRARYDFIVSSHNRHHLHWFVEAGFKNCAWLPGLKVRHTPRPFAASRNPVVAFVGNATEYHARRTRLIAALARAAVPIHSMRAPREASADIFASSRASFNASLNGDLNLRVFEILSSGGCLFTDRLTPESGLSLILDEGKEFIGYDNVEDCVEQARFILRNPKVALDVARAGNRAFAQKMTPEQRANELLAWVFDGRLDALYRVGEASSLSDSSSLLHSRIRAYEELQEIHRVLEKPKVLFASGIPEAYLRDALDLKRLNISIGDFAVDAAPSKDPAIWKRCSIAGRPRMETTNWDCIVVSKGTPIPPSIPCCHTVAV